MAKAKKNKNKKQKKKSSVKFNPKILLFLIAMAVMMMVYMAAALIFILGMMPTLAAYVTDKIPGKNKTLTIGALNFSVCFYYIMQIVTHPVPKDAAMDYLINPKTLIIIYCAALLGYFINYGVTILVASTLKQRSEMRLNKIEDSKRALIERWGQKVDGIKPLDVHGFPIDSHEKFE